MKKPWKLRAGQSAWVAAIANRTRNAGDIGAQDEALTQQGIDIVRG